MGVGMTFKALSDDTRREILKLLKEGDLSAGEIAEAFSITKPSISHHLNILKQADLVLDERQGQNIIYSLNTSVMDDILGWILEFTGNKGDDKSEEDDKDKGDNNYEKKTD